MSPETLARRVLSRLRAGSIVLLHDGDPGTLRAQRESTVLALPLILREGRARGFRFIGLEEALAARLPGRVDAS
jgi:peptidoglycan-N-acetylglucosamine deacetylase